MILTAAQKATYEQDGFLIYGPILSAAEIAVLRERIDALASDEQHAGVRLETTAERGELQDVSRRDKVWQLLDPQYYDTEILNHTRNPRILDIVSELLGTEDIKLYHA